MRCILHLPSPVPSSDLFFIVLHSIVDSVAIAENIILLLAIVYRSPRTLRSYAVLLVNCVLNDLVAALSTLMVMVRVIPVGELIAYVYDGPCVIVSSLFCHYLYSITLTTLSQSLFLIAASFAYRLYVLYRFPIALVGKNQIYSRKNPRPSQILLVCLLISIPNILVLATASFTLDDKDEIRRLLAIAKPEYVMDEYDIEGHVSIYNWIVLFSLFVVTAPNVPTLVLAKLHQKSNQMSLKTSKLHSSFSKVLSIQALLPTIFLSAIVNYYLCQTNVMCSPVQEHLIIGAASFVPLISPAITLYYVQPYRSFVEEHVFCRKKPKTSFVDSFAFREFSEKNDCLSLLNKNDDKDACACLSRHQTLSTNISSYK